MKTIAQVILSLVLIIFSCIDKKPALPKSGIYTDKNHSDFQLDEATITNYFKTYPENESIENEVYNFYRNRNFQYGWFTEKGMKKAVPNFYSQLESYRITFKDASFSNPQLDTLITLIKTDTTNSNRREKSKEQLELLLTTTFFKYSKKVYSGAAENLNRLDWFIPRNKKNYQVLLDSLVLTDENEVIYEPLSKLNP